MSTFSSQVITDLTARYTYGTWRYQKGWKPLHVADAEGCYFIDGSGKKYLDFSSQLMCSNLGHKNPAVIKAIEEQARKLPFIAPGFATDVRAELSKLLLEVLPQGLEKFFSQRRARRRTKPHSKLHACSQVKQKSSPATERTTARRWDRLHPDPRRGPVITSFVFRVRNVPAALYKAMGGFATNGVNMTKLESYMVGGRFEATLFYADVEGHPKDRSLALALEELRFFSREVKILGVYHAHPHRRKGQSGGDD